MRSFGIAISNGTTGVENAYNDQAYLKQAINDLKKTARSRLQKTMKKNLLIKTYMSFSRKDNGLLMPLKVKYFQWGL